MNNQTEKKKHNYLWIALIGGIFAAAILITGTILTGRSASSDTKEAVRNVSLLYLDELALRREQVVSSALDTYIRNMDTAIGLMESKDLESKESLQKYQTWIKQMYNLEKFAFVDEDGVIYTSRGTRSDIDQYGFDYQNLTGVEILIKNINSKDKTVIIAMPVDELPFEGKKLVACFIEISMENLLEGVSLKTDNNNTTFCNLYTKDGVALTDMILGGLASEDNLLTAMEKATLTEGETIEDLKSDFENGHEGVISFSYDGIDETLYYVPVHGTDWMLTYLIRESVIGDQIGSISSGIITRSFILSLVTAILLVVLFIYIIIQTRNNAKIAIEKEVAEAETRLKQQEIEEQLAMQDELTSALDAAEKASKAKTSFLSNMSHEIRTPITAVLGMNEMIQRESDDENILSYSDNIEKAGTSLLGIINDILDFSKIESGKLELNTAPYETGELITDLYNLVRFRAENKGLLLTFEIDPTLPKALVGDELRLKQVISNLLTNAVKYTERGSVHMEIKREAAPDDKKAQLYVCVTDTGIGIREEEMENLFNAFDRLDKDRTRTIEGTGLGLSIASKMLSLMGGQISVESTYNVGSSFSFRIAQEIADPAPIGPFDVKRSIHDVHGEKKRTSFTAPDAKLLIVDDTPMNLQVIAGLLKHTGMHIDTASSGSDCVELFDESDYDIVFLDYRMPGLDGIETLRELHRRYPKKCEKTPIICLTASAVSGDRERMLEAGFTDYLSKPVNTEKMEDTIRKYLPADMIHEAADADEPVPLPEQDALPEKLYSITLINPEEGLFYCGDAEDYLDALEIYSHSTEEKAALLEKSLAENDLETYALTIHSLKSTSKAIGATGLSARASALEIAAREKKADVLENETPAFLSDYRSLKVQIDEALARLS